MPLIFFELLSVLAPSAYVTGMQICEFFLAHPDLVEDLISFLLGRRAQPPPLPACRAIRSFGY